MSTLIKSIVGGVIGGVIGAVIWAVIALQFNYEIGFVAWGVGILVGALARVGAGDDASQVTGAAAAVIAIASVSAGKFAAVSASVDGAVSRIPAEQMTVTDEIAISYLARDVVNEFQRQGKPLSYPEDYEDAGRWSEGAFPTDVWAEAKGKWEAAGTAWQSEYRHWVDETRRHELREFVAAVKEEGFIESFGVFDLLFFALAIMSAYGIASGAGGD